MSAPSAQRKTVIVLLGAGVLALAFALGAWAWLIWGNNRAQILLPARHVDILVNTGRTAPIVQAVEYFAQANGFAERRNDLMTPQGARASIHFARKDGMHITLTQLSAARLNLGLYPTDEDSAAASLWPQLLSAVKPALDAHDRVADCDHDNDPRCRPPAQHP